MSYTDVEAVLSAWISPVDGVEQSTMKLVLACIARYTNSKKGDHTAWPSIDTLEVDTQLARSAVSRAIDALISVKAFSSYKQGGGREHSTYTLNMDVIQSWGNATWKAAKLKEPCHPSEEPCVPSGGSCHPSGGAQGTFRRTEPGSYPGFESAIQSGSEAGASLRSAPPAPLDEKKKTETGKPGNPSAVSGLSAKTGKDKSNPNIGTRYAVPWNGKTAFCNCSAEWNGDDNHAYTCPVVKARTAAAAAASKIPLGNVDEL